jgi:hypothetical protein
MGRSLSDLGKKRASEKFNAIFFNCLEKIKAFKKE